MSETQEMSWVCGDAESNNYGTTFGTPREALMGLGWWQNADGTWNEHGDCDGKGYTLEEALACCKVAQGMCPLTPIEALQELEGRATHHTYTDEAVCHECLGSTRGGAEIHHKPHCPIQVLRTGLQALAQERDVARAEAKAYKEGLEKAQQERVALEQRFWSPALAELPYKTGPWHTLKSYDGSTMVLESTTNHFGGQSDDAIVGLFMGDDEARLAALAPSLLHDVRLLRGLSCHCTSCSAVLAPAQADA